MTPVRMAGLMSVFAVAGFLPGDISATGSMGSTSSPQFAEVKWPFPMDQWGEGRAFQCRAGNCGIEINVYLRAKVGFCSCTNGVSDDDELERVGDLTILSDRYTALDRGHIVAMGPFNGRARPFNVELPLASERFALALAVNNKCDAVVATVVTDRVPGPEVERAALSFLNEDRVLKWADASTGLPE